RNRRQHAVRDRGRARPDRPRGLAPHGRKAPPMNERLRALGLNVQGVADGSKYEAWLPGCRSVIVFASGGSVLWEALLAACRVSLRRWADEDHPLDAFVGAEVLAADADPPRTSRWVLR